LGASGMTLATSIDINLVERPVQISIAIQFNDPFEAGLYIMTPVYASKTTRPIQSNPNQLA